MDPAKDALPGSCREFVGVHGVLDAAAEGRSRPRRPRQPARRAGSEWSTSGRARSASGGGGRSRTRARRYTPACSTTTGTRTTRRSSRGLLRFRSSLRPHGLGAAGDPHGPQPRPRAAAPRPAGELSARGSPSGSRPTPTCRSSGFGRRARGAPGSCGCSTRATAGRPLASVRTPGVPRAVGGRTVRVD